MFIVFEANEGAGKTTQARLLVESLRARGIDVVHTREPGGSPLAEEIRSLLVNGDPDRMSPTTELLLFTAARRDHVERTIRPALERGAVVICDRYMGSTHALQGAGGMDERLIDSLFDMFIGLEPDLTLFLDIDPEIGLSRRHAASGAAGVRFEEKGRAFHHRVSENFKALAATRRGWVTIEADRPVDVVAQEVQDIVMTRMRKAKANSGKAA